MDEKFGMGVTAKGSGCGVVECMKPEDPICLDMRMNEDDFVKRIYEGRIKREGVRGMKWIHKIHKY